MRALKSFYGTGLLLTISACGFGGLDGEYTQTLGENSVDTTERQGVEMTCRPKAGSDNQYGISELTLDAIFATHHKETRTEGSATMKLISGDPIGWEKVGLSGGTKKGYRELRLPEKNGFDVTFVYSNDGSTENLVWVRKEYRDRVKYTCGEVTPKRIDAPTLHSGPTTTQAPGSLKDALQTVIGPGSCGSSNMGIRVSCTSKSTADDIQFEMRMNSFASEMVWAKITAKNRPELPSKIESCVLLRNNENKEVISKLKDGQRDVGILLGNDDIMSVQIDVNESKILGAAYWKATENAHSQGFKQEYVPMVCKTETSK